MFYSHFILARKGPLGTIWIAAHLEGKLRKNQVTETNISASVDSILFSEVPIALRLSGHLLLGVVRIYSRKVNYLYHDCSEALVKIKHAFHCSSVDLPPDASKVPFHSITLPESFDFDEFEASFKWDKVHALAGEFADHHVSARDLITLKEQTQEEARGSLFDPDERFPDSYDPYYSLLHESNEEHADEPMPASNQKMSLQQEMGVTDLEEDVLPPLQIDEKMELDTEEMTHLEQGAPSPIHSSMHTFLDMPNSLPTNIEEKGERASSAFVSMQDIPDIEKLRAAPEQKEPEPFLLELEEEQVPSRNTILKTPGEKRSFLDELGPHDAEDTPVLKETPLLSGSSPIIAGEFDKYASNEDLLGEILGARTPAFKVVSSSRAVPEQKQRRRKRKAVFDSKPILSSVAMKKQLAGAGDLLRSRRKLPLTEFGMWRMQDAYHEQRFGMPSFPGFSASIRDLYSGLTGLPCKEQSMSSPINEEVHLPEAEFVVADNDTLDGAEASLYSHRNSPQCAQYIPASNPEGNDMDIQESQNEPVGRLGDGQQEERAEESGVGQELQDVWDTLPDVNHPSVSSRQDNDMLHHPEAVGTQASSNGVNVVTPLVSPSLTCSTPRQPLNMSAHGLSVIPKLDFLEASSDNAFLPADYGAEDSFVDETDTNSYRKGRPYQSNYGWSARTKFVAKYLKSVFEELEATAGPQPVQVSLDSLLKGRTRKEAARLYFETLVLKSRDFIDVEQKTGFAEIMLSSTHLLRKGLL